MILLFSDASLGLASSEGGVGEFGSFFVRAEGMVEGTGRGGDGTWVWAWAWASEAQALAEAGARREEFGGGEAEG